MSIAEDYVASVFSVAPIGIREVLPRVFGVRRLHCIDNQERVCSTGHCALKWRQIVQMGKRFKRLLGKGGGIVPGPEGFVAVAVGPLSSWNRQLGEAVQIMQLGD